MRAEPEICLTNDDGIDAPGIAALDGALGSVGSTTVVAPRENRSAVGRSLSYGRAGGGDEVELSVSFADGTFTCPVPHADHERGIAVDGTPCDCAIVGVNALKPTPDLLVSGCNSGANLGAFVFARSGTVSAAMEAAFLGTPAIAVSMDTLGYERELTPADFERAGRIAAALTEAVVETDLPKRVDYLNVNVPRPDRELAGVAVTRPTEVYEMDAAYRDGRFELTNVLWRDMAAGEIPDPPGTDRRALLEGKVSVSPLSAPYEVRDEPAVRETIEAALDGVVPV
ncbi:5'/3'-nucleotidase SurE [Halovivax sp.]|uniref:5'/3'-nucleotidase SurE n=1 Tax=Halovivax sp. TaxID=1935978 RepID=UPI0025C070B6|nr:5'/3'-nucleotidase SurE [Halovivax sp.]